MTTAQLKLCKQKKQDNSGIFKPHLYTSFKKLLRVTVQRCPYFTFQTIHRNDWRSYPFKKYDCLHGIQVLYNKKSKNKNLLCVTLYESSPPLTHVVAAQNLAVMSNKFIVFTDSVKYCSCYVGVTIKFLLNMYR